jgi:uncharacterized protein DUF4349
MSSRKQIDERFDELVGELRSGQATASPELRERVRAIAAGAPRMERRGSFVERLSWRRAALVLAPACIVAAVSAALLHGLSSTGSQTTAADEPAAFRAHRERALGGTLNRVREAPAPVAESAAPPPPSSRLQDYRVNLRVRVASNEALSRATVRAMRLTRSLGGYVASVHYSTPSVRHGDAVLILRVPIRNVQRAVLGYAGLGTIVAQHFSVIDLQKRHDAQIERAAKLRAQIAQLEARLQTEALSDVERAQVEEQLEYARSQLTILTRQTRTTLNRARLATARLSLTTFRAKEKQEVIPLPSRFDRMLDDAGRVLAHEVVWAGYAVFVGGPLLLLALVALAAGRSHRRRSERRLLAATR